MCNDLANAEALMNIGANLSEIAGIAGGMNAFMWCWIPHVNNCPGGWTKKMLIQGPLILIAALAIPGTVNWAVAENMQLGMAVSLISTLVMVPLGVMTFFLPARIALKHNKPKSGLVSTLNCLVFIPFIFPIALSIATRGAQPAGPQTLGCHQDHTGESAET